MFKEKKEMSWMISKLNISYVQYGQPFFGGVRKDFLYEAFVFRSRCGTYFDSVCAKPVGLSCLRIECHFIHTSSVWDWHIPIRSMTCVQVGETLVLNATEIVNGEFTLCFGWELELRLSCFMRWDPSEHTLLTVPLDKNAVSDECLKSHRVGIVSHSTCVWKCFTT